MKFNAALVSLAVAFAGVAQAAHLPAKHHKRTGPSAVYSSTAAASTPATPAAPAPPAQSAASGSIKRGLSFNDVAATQQFTSSQVSWAYNWDSSHSGSLPPGIVYAPMLWGDDAGHTSDWVDNANAAIAAGAEYLFCFNEPDLSTQSNMTPAQAVAAWKQWCEPFAGKAKLISPAITNGGAPMGTAWLDEFMQQCTGCTIYGVAAHIYDSATNIAYYKSYITDLGTRYNKPVFLTEFGATGSTAQIQTFLQTMVQFLDGLDTVERYAYFMDASGGLVNSDNSISSLGQTYISS